MDIFLAIFGPFFAGCDTILGLIGSSAVPTVDSFLRRLSATTRFDPVSIGRVLGIRFAPGTGGGLRPWTLPGTNNVETIVASPW